MSAGDQHHGGGKPEGTHMNTHSFHADTTATQPTPTPHEVSHRLKTKQSCAWWMRLSLNICRAGQDSLQCPLTGAFNHLRLSGNCLCVSRCACFCIGDFPHQPLCRRTNIFNTGRYSNQLPNKLLFNVRVLFWGSYNEKQVFPLSEVKHTECELMLLIWWISLFMFTQCWIN